MVCMSSSNARTFESGMQDPLVERFVFVSADAVPLKTFEVFFAAESMAPCFDCSGFCSDEKEQTAETWQTLSRRHALLLLGHQDLLSRVFDPIRCCVEEVIFYWPLVQLVAPSEINASACPMWTDWPAKKGWSQRKFPTIANYHVGKLRKGTLVHPTTWQMVPEQGLQELLQAPGVFLARKFLRNTTVQLSSSKGQLPLGLYLQRVLALNPSSTNPSSTSRANFVHPLQAPILGRVHEPFWKRALCLLQAMHDILQPIHVPVILMYGTLLRWYRDGANSVSMDHDVDVAVFAEDWNKIPWQSIGERAADLSWQQHDSDGYRLHRSWPWRNMKADFVQLEHGHIKQAVVKILTWHGKEFYFDVWVIYKSAPGSGFGGYMCADVDQNASIPQRYTQLLRPFKVADAEFLGVPVNVPLDPASMLDDLYGPSWKTPLSQKQSDDVGFQVKRVSCEQTFKELYSPLREYIMPKPK